MPFKNVNRNKKIEKNLNMTISFVAVVGLFILFHRFTPFVYSTNDDIFLNSIVSGEASGVADGHMIYSGYLLGLILSFLYRINALVPWYGMYLAISLLICMFLSLYQILIHTKRIYQKFFVSGVYGLITFEVLMQHFALIQFTVVAAVVSGTAIFWFYMIDTNKATKQYLLANIPTGLLALLAIQIRMKVFLMFLPIAGALWIAKCIEEKCFVEKQKIKKYLLLLLEIGGILAISVTIEMVSYGSTEWSEYREYNRAREKIYDFYGYPNYSENEDLYEGLNISEESYIAASTRYNVLLDSNINRDSMVKLANYREEEVAEETVLNEKLSIMLKDLREHHIGYSDRPLCLIVLFSYIFVIFFIVFTRKWKTFIALGLMISGRMISWTYVFYGGRYPVRITQALFLVELMLLLGIFMKHELYKMKHKWFPYVLGTAYTILVVLSGARYVKATQGIVTYRNNISNGYEELKEYMAVHEKDIFYLDIDVVNYYTVDIFKSNLVIKNQVVMGSWLPKSPLNEEKIRKIDEVYFVFQEGELSNYDYLEAYVARIKEEGILSQDCHVVIKDTLITTNGTVYKILKIENAIQEADK